MQTINNTIIHALDIADMPADMQEDVLARTSAGILQSVMIHAFMTLPLQDQHTLMEYLDQDKPIQEIYAWLETKLTDLPEVVADALARYVMA
jgi:hypothetical protein